MIKKTTVNELINLVTLYISSKIRRHTTYIYAFIYIKKKGILQNKKKVVLPICQLPNNNN